ncbi:hypothetical protein LCGC14_1239500 [marine sediment metagenome]|uniref:Uncharacterized protein n=1 Tax=marine sediment metagenome TaxID=412755 RepID=A0A0F9NNG9_9ZZZZ
MATHAFSRQGPGGTAAGEETQIGANLDMPAGGPWTIHHVWAQVVRATTIPDQGTGGTLHVQAISGDLTPDPAPGKYPLIGSPISESANAALSAVPLNLWPVNWQAAGKALLSLSYIQQLAITTPSEVACGIIFGDSIPEVRPLMFCDVVSTAWASASEQAVGTLQLSEKATRIVGILADLNKGDASTTAEEVMATIRLGSADIKIPPAQYPCNRAFNASDGTAAGQSAVAMSNFIPVDIPVIGGARIDVFVTSSISVTSNAEVRVYLAYE